MDVPLIIAVAIFSILVLIGSIYFLIYFQDPSDKWNAWFPKIISILGLSIACFNILLLPLDVANQKGLYKATGGIPMEMLNISLFLITVGFVFIVIPFAVFYYEGADDSDSEKSSTGKQLFNAFKWVVPTIILLIAAITPLYIFLGHAEITTSNLTGNFVRDTKDPFALFCDSTSGPFSCTKSKIVEKIKVSLVVYIIAITSFVGWILFSVFGGIGLFSLPIDIFLGFKYRPKPIKQSEYLDKKRAIGEISTILLVKHDEIQKLRKSGVVPGNFNSRSRQLKRNENEFKRDVFLLDEQYHKLEQGYKENGGNPILIYSKLFFGILGLILSIGWFFHLLLYLVPIAVHVQPVTPFLNDVFILFSSAPLFGPLTYGLFAFWLLLCVVKGNVKMGMRVLFIEIHPMRIGQTMMSSIVFNVGLILLCSLSVVQFCAISFQEYARYTSIITLFSTQIQSLAYIKYGYSAFIFLFLASVILSSLYLKLKPYQRTSAKTKISV